MIRDLRYAARVLLAHPGFALAAILTLGLGIGATTAIFGLAEAALWRALPVEEPERLVLMRMRRADGGIGANLSHPSYLDYRDASPAADLSGLAAHAPLAIALGSEAGAERVDGAIVSANFFDVLGLRPATGRFFLPEEDRAGGAGGTAVISHDVWRRRFAASPSVAGTTVPLNGRLFTIAGVAPESFDGIVRGRSERIWVPLGASSSFFPSEDMLGGRRIRWLTVIGRLAPGVSPARAQASLDLVDRRIAAATHRQPDESAVLVPGGRGLTDLVGGLAAPLLALAAMVGLLLLITCANVASLLVSRSEGRRREIAVRLALGARSGRIVRQLLTESLLVSALGGAAGLLLALWGPGLMRISTPEGGFITAGAHLDARTLAFTAALSVLAALLFGLAPALRASHAAPAAALKSASGTLVAGGRARPRDLLVVAQVALCVVVLVAAGLLARSLGRLERVDPGFDDRDVMLFTIDLEARGLDPDRGRAFYLQALERLAAAPGVAGASLAEVVTPSPFGSRVDGVVLDGYRAGPGETIGFDMNVVGPGYFETLGIPLLRGRGFDHRDIAGAPGVAVVNESFARRYWRDEDPIGRRIFLGEDTTAPAVTIIGVAADGKYRSLREGGAPNVTMPVLQRYRPAMTLLIRSGEDPGRLAAMVRREIRAIDPAVPLFDVRSLREHVRAGLSQDRLLASTAALFGSLALALAVIGIHGVMSCFVSQRVREIGIRMALGGSPGDIRALVMREGMRLALAGILAGLPAALAVAWTLRGLLFGVGSADMTTLTGVTLLLLMAALAACWLPARRATAIEPMGALRCE